MQVQTSILKGIKWTTIGSLSATVLQMVQQFALAFYLVPEDFGKMAAVLIAYAFLLPLIDLGVGEAIIAGKAFSRKQLSTLWWVNLIAGVVGGLLLFAFAPLITHTFFSGTEIQWLLHFASILIVIHSTSVIYRALLAKKQRFRELNIIQVCTSFIAAFLAISLAHLGFGVLSLLLAFAVSTLLSSLLAIWFCRADFIPSLSFDIHQVKNSLKFAVFKTGSSVVNVVNANIDKLIIGGLIGIEALGLYTWVWSMVMLPLRKFNPVFNKVAFPVFSANRSNWEEVNQVYADGVTILMALAIPLLGLFAVSSEAFIMGLYGVEWLEAIPLIPILCGVGLLKTFANPGGSILLARGRSDIEFFWNIGWAIWVYIIIYFGVVFLGKSVLIVGWMQLLAGLSAAWVWHYLVSKVGEIKYARLIKQLVPVFISGFLAVLVAALVGRYLFLDGVSRLFCQVFIGSTVYVCTIYLIYRVYFSGRIAKIVSRI